MDETPSVSARQTLDDMRAGYDAFLQKLEHSRATSVGEIMGNFFRSQGNPRVTYAMEEFNPVLTAQVAALAEQLGTCASEEAGALADQALELMLFYPPSKDSTIASSLMAFEGHSLPLIPFLIPERRQELARRYAKRNPPRMMFPNQKKVWSALSMR